MHCLGGEQGEGSRHMRAGWENCQGAELPAAMPGWQRSRALCSKPRVLAAVPAVPTCQVDEVQHGGLAGGVGEAHGQQGVGAGGVGVKGGGRSGPVLAALCSRCTRGRFTCRGWKLSHLCMTRCRAAKSLQ
jgi:hypothetical protein